MTAYRRATTMNTIQATDDLVIELWPAGKVFDRPVLRLRSLGAELEGDRQSVVIHLEEARPVAEALLQAAVELTTPTESPSAASVLGPLGEEKL